MKRTLVFYVLLPALMFVASSAFSAYVLAKSGKIFGDILKIDREGVVVQSKFGTITIQANEILYVVVDEKEFEEKYSASERSGIILRNGLFVFGDPVNITQSGGVIEGKIWKVELSLKDVVFFSYAKDTSLERFAERLSELGHFPHIVEGRTEEYIFTLIDGQTVSGALKKTETKDGATFIELVSFGTTIRLLSNVIWRIEVPSKISREYAFVALLKNGSTLLCTPVFMSGRVLLSLPIALSLTVNWSDMLRIVDKFQAPPPSSFKLYVDGVLQQSVNVVSSDYYNTSITIISDEMNLDGEVVEKIRTQLLGEK